MANADSPRELTTAELRRKTAFEDAAAKLEAAGYVRRDLTIGIVKANILAIAYTLPVIIVFGIAFFLAQPGGQVSFSLGASSDADSLAAILSPLVSLVAFFIAFAILAVVHELIHGLFWGIFAPSHFKAVEFGFIKKYLTPYCTCSEALSKMQYLIGALMPTIVLGIIPCLVAIATGSLPLFIMGALMTLSGGGDVAIVVGLLRHRAPSAIYMDHPYECGLVAFEPAR